MTEDETVARASHPPADGSADEQQAEGSSIGLSDELTRFQIDLLVAAARLGEEASGQDLKRRILDTWTDGDTAITHGRLYANLDKLVDRGLLQRGSIDRRTNEYRITGAGQRVLADRRQWLQTPSLN